MIRALAAAALLAVGAPALAGQTVPPNAPGQYVPRDECGDVVGATAFREALADAVRQRDAVLVSDLASPNVKLDFGGGEGQDELRRRLYAVGGEELWQALSNVLDGGCADDADQGLLFLPWFHAQDLGDADPYSTWLVAGYAIPLREGPSQDALEFAQLHWQLVMPFDEGEDSGAFRKVRIIGSSVEGYVEAARLRSPLDYRIVARKVDEDWKILSFVAGD